MQRLRPARDLSRPPLVQAVFVLDRSQRVEGYGIMRVVFNVSAAVGPSLGGLIATQSFAYLFVGDAISSIGTAVVFWLVIDESRP